MASTSAERKAKQRQEMIEKGFVRKDMWLSKESIEVIEAYKIKHELKSNDEALNQIIKDLT